MPLHCEETEGCFLSCFSKMCVQTKILYMYQQVFLFFHPSLFPAMYALQLLPDFFFFFNFRRRLNPWKIDLLCLHRQLQKLHCCSCCAAREYSVGKLVNFTLTIWKLRFLTSIQIMHLKALISLFQRITIVQYFD